MNAINIGEAKLFINGKEVTGIRDIEFATTQIESNIPLKKEFSCTANVELTEQAKQWIHKLKLSRLAHETWLRKVTQ